MKKIGILGGTFDPIHIGHLIIAETARIYYSLDEVVFMPAKNPPHKNGIKITEASHRYNMVVLAIKDNPKFSVSPLELNREGLSYTIDTVKDLKKIYPEETEFYFIIGKDMAGTLREWKDINDLLKLCYFLVVMRSVDNNDYVDETIESFSDSEKLKIKKLDTMEIDISSTEIRDKLKSGEEIKYIVTKDIDKYIREHNLYAD